MKDGKIKIIIGILCLAVFSCFVSCRSDEPEGGKINGVKFGESSRSLLVGDVVTIAINISPEEAKNTDKVVYSVSQAGIIEIKPGSSNHGVIIEAKSRGTVVLTGKIAGFVDYCNITVGGSDERIIPHIISPVQVIEMPSNERRSITVSLAGGTPADNTGFLWSYTNQDVVQFTSTANVGILDAVKPGETVVTVRHPKAQYEVNILVYVLGGNQTPVYITSETHVINLKNNSGSNQFMVELRGGNSGDENGFVYEVVDGSDVISLSGNAKIGTVTPQKAGIALIRVYHQKTQHPYEIQVIVGEEFEYRYIDVNQTLVLLQSGETSVIQAQFVGDVPNDFINKYYFSVSRDDIISVSQSQDLFFINTGDRSGNVILKIGNEYADFLREILVVVHNPVEGIIDNEKYISTSQNVVTMEAFGSDAILNMMLVGGNEADANGFVWTVDDSTIITVVSQHGIVRELDTSRAMISNIPIEKFQSQALITPKKTGTTKITVQHPKAKNEMTVVVKVYPKGTFGSVPVVLGGSPYYSVEKGKSVEIDLYGASGDSNNLGDVTWSVDNGAVASVSGTALKGVVNGLSSGTATLTVSGGNLKHPFSAVLVVADKDDLSSQKFIYMLNPFASITVGQSMMTSIMSMNMTKNEIKNINFINNNSDVISVYNSGNALVLTGLKTGVAEIVMKGSDTNEIKLVVTVEDQKINVDQPFYLTGENDIIGIVKGSSLEYSVTLVGGTGRDESSLIWNVDNSQVVQAVGSGKKGRLTAIAEGQAVVTITHPKSVNDLKVIVYVVANANDVNNKVAIYAEQNNCLLRQGERIFINLKTNATPAQKRGIQWNIDNPDIVELDVSSDNMMAFITGLKPGVARIAVGHNQNIVPQVIYISVVGQKQGVRYIGVPPIVETVAGNNVEVRAVLQNISDWEANNIVWGIENNTIASIAGNGSKCLVQAKSNGHTVITVGQSELGFYNRIILYVYKSYEEMTSSYVMGAEQSYYRVAKGDLIDVSLVFGAKGFPEHEIGNIRWSAGDNNVVSVQGNGKNAHIKALNNGIGYIYAESNAAKNKKIEIEIEVVDKIFANDGYRFEIDANDRVKGMVVGAFADILVRIFNGSSEVFSGYDQLEISVDDSNVIGIIVIDNNIRVNAKKAGQSYINIRHQQVAGETRILIYTADNANDLENMYPVSFEKNNYLIKKGDTVRISAQTRDNDEGKLSRLRFDLERNNGVISVSPLNYKEINVSALEKGNEIILVRYDNTIVQRIYVSVTVTENGDLATYLVTENIIGMLIGSTYEAKVNTNIPDYLQGGIYWVSDDESTVSIVSFNGTTASLRANKAGKAYITVKANTIERKLLVFVCATQNELKNYHAVNIEQRYFAVTKGKSFNLNLYSYQGSVQGTTGYSDYYSSGGNFCNVIELNNLTNKGVTIKAKQEGIAAIRITNPFYNFDAVVYIEVQPVQNSGAKDVTLNNYLTAQKTLYIIEKGESDVPVQISVSGENFYEYGYFEWRGYDNSKIKIDAMGATAYVTALAYGQTEITVSNVFCENSITITVIVGDRYILENNAQPYIYVEKNVYDYNVNEGTSIIYYEVRNHGGFDYSGIKCDIEGNSVNVNSSIPGRLLVTPYTAGQTKIRLYANENLSVILYFIVRETESQGTVYLTTNENLIIGSVYEVKSTDIRLVGYNEMDSNKFEWKIDKKSVAQVVGNGNRGHIYPVAEGEAVITVNHPKANNTLQIYVKIVKDAVSQQAVYLTTQTNVIEGVVGEQGYIYLQKIGGNPSNTNCIWSVDNPSVVSVIGNGLTGMFSVKKAGTARISVTNSETSGKMPLQIVVLAKEPSGSSLFISSNETLLEMAPGAVNRRLTVELVGGSERDNAKLTYVLYHQNPSDLKIAAAQGNVVSIVAQASQLNINAINEGVAKIRVSHEKADNPLYITVRVTKYNEIMFPENQKQMAVGNSEFVQINVPTYENFKEKVIYTTDNPEVCTIVGNNNIALLTAHGEGYAIVRARIEGKEGEAELYVNVVNVEDPNTLRIITPRTSYVLNPRSNPEVIKAAVSGGGVVDMINDGIWWELVNLDGDSPVLDIYPAQALDKLKGSREIQISPRREGEAIIRIGHDYVESKYHKVLYIKVSETENALTLDKNIINIGFTTGVPKLRATILGGKSKDYDDIQWTVTYKELYDGTLQEVVRIMGEGREVSLYPINDGTCIVTAFYKGLLKECAVNVESQQTFSVQAQVIKMYPGEIIDLPFDVKPSDSYILWHSSEEGKTDPVFTYEPMVSSSSKILKLTAVNEGNATIQGIANGKMVRTTIAVAYSYNIYSSTSVIFKPSSANGSNTRVINYTIYPPNCIPELVIPENIKSGLIVDMRLPQAEGSDEVGKVGNGELHLTALREIPLTPITWRIKKPDGNIVPGVEFITKISAFYDDPPEKLTPYFVRVDGVWSNAIVTLTENNPSRAIARNGNAYVKPGTAATLGETIPKNTNGNYNLKIGDGESHYIAFDRNYPNSSVDISVGPLNNLSNKINIVLEDIENSGEKHKVLRIESKGKDVLKYDRVMFNKRLYVTLRSNYAIGGGSGSKIETIDLNTEVKSVSLQTGWEPYTVELWNDKRLFTYEQARWYAYSEAHASLIGEDNFIRTDSIGYFDESYPYVDEVSYPWASQESSYTISDEISGIETTVNGFSFIVPLKKEGYFYSQTILNQNIMLFVNKDWQTSVPPQAQGVFILLEGVTREDQIGVFENRIVYFYDETIAQNINGFAHVRNEPIANAYNNRNILREEFEGFDGEEAGWDGKELVWEDPGVLTEKKSGFSYSFKLYSNTVETIVPGELNESKWDVFSNEAYRQRWVGQRVFGFAENSVGFFNSQPMSAHNQRYALHYSYFGLQESPMYWTNTQTVVVSSGSMGSNIVTKTITTQGTYSTNGGGGWSWGREMLNARYGGNTHCGGADHPQYLFVGDTKIQNRVDLPKTLNMNNPSIFATSDSDAGGSGGVAQGMYGAWSSLYYNSTLSHQWRDANHKCYTEVLAGMISTQHMVDWEESNYPSIVPIERLLVFPFFLNFTEYSASNNRYIIDYKNPNTFGILNRNITSTPMPSINTKPNTTTDTVQVELSYFDGRREVISFEITYEERVSHHLFSGNGDPVGSCNTTGKREITEGDVTWTNGKIKLVPTNTSGTNIYGSSVVKRDEYWEPQR